MENRSLLHLCVALVLLIVIQACNPTPQVSDADRLPTMETPIVDPSTATATPIKATPTEEPVQPSATQEATPIPSTMTPQATSTSVDLGPTETALAPILGELQLYGVDPQQGQLGWLLTSLSVEIDQYHGSEFENPFPTVTAKDFVLS